MAAERVCGMRHSAARRAVEAVLGHGAGAEKGLALAPQIALLMTAHDLAGRRSDDGADQEERNDQKHEGLLAATAGRPLKRLGEADDPP
jgi:hypothetical protein